MDNLLAKKCSRCAIMKPVAAFSRDKTRKDGLHFWCKECHSKYHAAYRTAKRASITQQKQRWVKANQQHVSTYKATWHQENKNKFKKTRAAYSAAWKKQNRKKVCEYQHRRRARTLHANGHSSAEQITLRATLWGQRCWICGGPYETDDHVIALSRGGSNWPANIRPACNSCNCKKGNRDWRAWVRKASYNTKNLP